MDIIKEPYVNTDENQRSAPLAQAEDSDEDQDSNMSQISKEGSKFAEVLRKKELARKEGPGKPEIKTSSSSSTYLTSRFMKNKNIFENSKQSSTAEPKRSSIHINSSRLSGIEQKRSAFQRQGPRSKTIDIVDTAVENKTSKINRNGISSSSRPANTSVTSSSGAIVAKQSGGDAAVSKSKISARRLMSDSVLSSRKTSAEKIREEKSSVGQVKKTDKSDGNQRESNNSTSVLAEGKGSNGLQEDKPEICSDRNVAQGIIEKQADVVKHGTDNQRINTAISEETTAVLKNHGQSSEMSSSKVKSECSSPVRRRIRSSSGSREGDVNESCQVERKTDAKESVTKDLRVASDVPGTTSSSLVRRRIRSSSGSTEGDVNESCQVERKTDTKESVTKDLRVASDVPGRTSSSLVRRRPRISDIIREKDNVVEERKPKADETPSIVTEVESISSPTRRRNRDIFGISENIKEQNSSGIENEETKVDEIESNKKDIEPSSSPIRRRNCDIFGISENIAVEKTTSLEERKTEMDEDVSNNNTVAKEEAVVARTESEGSSAGKRNREIFGISDGGDADKKLSSSQGESKTKELEKVAEEQGRVSRITSQTSEDEDKEREPDRVGSRRRRERRTHRAKAVDPSDIAQVTGQRTIEVVEATGAGDDTIIPDTAAVNNTSNADSGANLVTAAKDSRIDAKKDEEIPAIATTPEIKIVDSDTNGSIGDVQDGKLRKDADADKRKMNIVIASTKNELLSRIDKDNEDEESSGSSSGPKLTTRSVIKDKIRQKKHMKHRAERTMSLPAGVNVVITPPTDGGGYVVTKKPPAVPLRKTREADDISLLRKAKRPLRTRPKTLTQGIDPSLLLNDIRSKEEAVVIEETLSITQIKQRLLQSEAVSGSRTPKTPDIQRKNKRRSGKRYKTITEGIAPGMLEKAQQFTHGDNQPHLLGLEHMNKLNLALSASTENLKRRSFIVSEVNSRIGSKGQSLSTSVEDLSMKDDLDEKPAADSVVEESIKRLKKLPMVFDSDDDEEQGPSVSSLKQKFMQAVEDSYKATKGKVLMRKKRGSKDRPFTISGLDDLTMRKIQIDINERHEYEDEAASTHKPIQDKLKIDHSVPEKKKDIDVLTEEEIEEILEAEGLTADQLAAELGINPSLARGSPLRSRKPFLGSTTEETVGDMLEVIEEKPEKQAAPLGDLKQQFLSAMTEFKSGSFDEDSETATTTDNKSKQRKVGVVMTTEHANGGTAEEVEPQSDLDFITQNVSQ